MFLSRSDSSSPTVVVEANSAENRARSGDFPSVVAYLRHCARDVRLGCFLIPGNQSDAKLVQLIQ